MENDNEYVNAEWARKTAETQLGAVVKKQLDSALTRIKEEVKKNKMLANCYFNMEELTQQELVKRGFKVKKINPDPRDYRDDGYYEITW